MKHLRGVGRKVGAGGRGARRTKPGRAWFARLWRGLASPHCQPALLFAALSLIGSLPPPVPASCVVSVVFSDAPSLGTMIATSQQVFVVRTR